MHVSYSIVVRFHAKCSTCSLSSYLQFRQFGASTRGDFATTSLSGKIRLLRGVRKKAFRQDCARIWGNHYDYSRSKYEDNHSPVDIICARHGLFKLRPRDHIQRRMGCPKCFPVAESASQTQTLGSSLSLSPPPMGQHILRSPEIAARIAAAALPDDNLAASVAEIGIGTGALTRALLERPQCRRVVGFEVDAQMVQTLDSIGAAIGMPAGASVWKRDDWHWKLPQERDGTRCIVFHGDFLRCASLPIECEIAVGNVPYRISGAIVLKLLEQSPALRRIVLLVQAEFARRLLARPGDLKYDRLSVLTSLLCGEERFLAFPGKVPPEVFHPPPRVDSAVVCLEPDVGGLASKGLPDMQVRELDRLLRVLFDGARGPMRGESLEKTLGAKALDLGLPRGWRSAVERTGLGHRPAVSLRPEECVQLAVELRAIGSIFERAGFYESDSAHQQ